MSVPPADFQLHNSLFLVAHFHTMIVGGVLFGYFAGLMYWFPKFFGYKLNELLGKYTFWFWFIGFLLAFVPLYILGLMGATRRLDHYNASLGWQPLFIVAGIGAVIIAIGVLFIVLQQVVSYFQRKDNLDTTGDPWNGRTLEWSVASPAPFYNFAHTPEVNDRDAFWAMKQSKYVEKKEYQDIVMPKNTSASIIIGAFSLLFGFGMIWHIWLLVGLGLFGVVLTIIIRATKDDTEYIVPASVIEAYEKSAKRKKSLA
jgi:cytochrome o ubiquinol oxidase subunit 1